MCVCVSGGVCPGGVSRGCVSGDVCPVDAVHPLRTQRQNPLPCEQNNRQEYKHYLSATSFADGKNTKQNCWFSSYSERGKCQGLTNWLKFLKQPIGSRIQLN